MWTTSPGGRGSAIHPRGNRNWFMPMTFPTLTSGGDPGSGDDPGLCGLELRERLGVVSAQGRQTSSGQYASMCVKSASVVSIVSS